MESKKYIVKKVDLSLGHDLTNEDFVKDYFLNNKADSIINLFSLNHHIDIGLKSTNLFNIDLNSFRKYLEVNLTALFSVSIPSGLNLLFQVLKNI